MRGLLGTFAAALSVLAVAGAARADEIRVPGDYRNLSDALEAASPGDTIVLRRGTQRGPVVIGVPDLTLRGERGARIRGALRGPGGSKFGPAILVRAPGVTVRGLTIVQGSVEAGSTGGIDGDFTLEDCTLRRRATLNGAASVYLLGDRMTVRGNRLVLRGRRVNQTMGIFVDGSDATVAGNTVEGRSPWSRGVRVQGRRARVEANAVGPVAVQGIVVLGEEATVADNELEGANIEAWGDDSLITGNTTRGAPAGLPSIWINGIGNTARDNVSESAGDTGLLVWGNGNLLVGNRVSRSGSDPEGRTPGHGIVVRGSGNTLSGSLVEDSLGEGFRVAGSAGPGWDRYSVPFEATGEGNVITGCTGTGSGTCGLGNWLPGTTVTGSTFTGNGVDVVDGQGFTAFEGNAFDTGGPGFSGTGRDDGTCGDYGVEGGFLGGD